MSPEQSTEPRQEASSGDQCRTLQNAACHQLEDEEAVAGRKPVAWKGSCGDSRPRLSAEQSSGAFDSRVVSAVRFEISAKLARGHSKLGIALQVGKVELCSPGQPGAAVPTKTIAWASRP